MLLNFESRRLYLDEIVGVGLLVVRTVILRAQVAYCWILPSLTKYLRSLTPIAIIKVGLRSGTGYLDPLVT